MFTDVTHTMANDLLEKRREQVFPKLAQQQLARLDAHGRHMQVKAGDILAEPGQRHRDLLVVLSGSIEIVVPGMAGEAMLTVLEPGEFAGEMSTLRGVAGLARIRVRESGEILSIPEESLRHIVQTDAELSEIMMRAFILRRVGMLSFGKSDLMVVGSRHSGDTLRLSKFLTRNAYPYVSIDVDSDPGVQELLDRFHVGLDDVPVVIGRGATVLKNPSLNEMAEFLGMNPTVDTATVHDMIVVGAGPAGLAAAVYGASEGLDVYVLESVAPGGQAGTSSRIENYLGFPTGISGQALAGRALTQAQKFGANVNIASQVLRLNCDQRPYSIELSDGRVVLASVIVIATGAQYRELALANLSRFVGVGVYHAATYLEAKLCADQEVVIVGGGNSAGQAAVFLATACRHVHVMVRADGLADSMSRYLIRRIEESPNITLHARTELTALEGSDRLERISWRCNLSGASDTRDIGHVFLMTGAVPNTKWLIDCVALDDKGFVRTGSDLSAEDLAHARWPLQRPPHLLETSLPGVFAVGDVRSGSTKRIASAVGEGSISVQFVHQVLRELAGPSQSKAVAAA